MSYYNLTKLAEEQYEKPSPAAIGFFSGAGIGAGVGLHKGVKHAKKVYLEGKQSLAPLEKSMNSAFDAYKSYNKSIEASQRALPQHVSSLSGAIKHLKDVDAGKFGRGEDAARLKKMLLGDISHNQDMINIHKRALSPENIDKLRKLQLADDAAKSVFLSTQRANTIKNNSAILKARSLTNKGTAIGGLAGLTLGAGVDLYRRHKNKNKDN